ncbi:NAD-binding protein [Halocella sp. SP3-1]|uniref:NAD-binding protein n=1 Tax=Halocella sp. SP3-1 TaxID=2382161 RepID=UPI000F763B7F|nr:NAD-binding protein [Halocella sp. SP3-1]AZO95360.1 hypothetical protein D7D81_12565 [Halocella sp. SP3-1]
MLFKTKSNKIIILGIDKNSQILADYLSKKNDIIILDKNYSKYPDIDVFFDNFDNGLVEILKKHNIADVYSFIAMTDNNEYNLFAAELAKNMGADKTICLTSNSCYLEIKSNIDLIINPYQVIIDYLSYLLKETRLVNIMNLIPGKINISSIKVVNDDSFSYIRVKDIELIDTLIIAIKRQHRTFVPQPETKIYPDDLIYILFKKSIINNLFGLFNRYKKKRRLFIIGANQLARLLIKGWKKLFEPIIIIDPDLAKCNKFADEFDNILILHGEGTDTQLLSEEGLNTKSILINLSDNDFANLLGSYSSKKYACQNVYTIINNHKHCKIAELLNLENTISVPEVIKDYLSDFINSSQRINKYFLGDEVYTTELRINNKHNKKVKDYKLPSGIIIGLIIRDNEYIIPDGESLLKKDDRLIIFFNKKNEIKLHNKFL